MRGLRGSLGVAASTGLGLALVWLLFSLVSASPAHVFEAMLSAPIWLYVIVIAFTLANQVVGALKWQIAAEHLARPVARPSLFRMLELTSVGAFFGQLMPIQISTLLARWFLLDRDTRESGFVARATVFEQTFDLILVLAGSVAAVAVIGFDLALAPALIAFVFAMGLSLVALRSLLKGCAALSGILATRGRFRALAVPAAEGFAHASAAPARVLALLSLCSLFRLLLVGLRAAVVFAVFAPQTKSWLVVVASPPVALLTSLPIAPAGLGVAEWTWSALLLLGGTAAPVAASAALNLRLANAVALLVIVSALPIGRRIAGVFAKPRIPET